MSQLDPSRLLNGLCLLGVVYYGIPTVIALAHVLYDKGIIP